MLMRVVLLIRTLSAITLFVCIQKILAFKTHEGLLTKCSLVGRLDAPTHVFIFSIWKYSDTGNPIKKNLENGQTSTTKPWRSSRYLIMSECSKMIIGMQACFLFFPNPYLYTSMRFVSFIPNRRGYKYKT